MNWQQRISIQPGDKVCYSKAFLQATGQYTGDVPQARGVVRKLVELAGTTIAEIEWNNPDIPERVNVKNLTKVTERGIPE